MTTITSPLNRQPTMLDYSSPTQFRFLINQLPKVQYFTTEANLPGITLSDRKQFSDFRSATSNVATNTRGESKDIGDVKASTPERAMYSDAVLTILTNKNNPVVECRFKDVFPINLGGLTYTQNSTDVEYLTSTVTFKYQIYEIVTL